MLVGNEGGVVGVDDEAVFEAEGHDEVVAGGADDRPGGAQAEVLAGDGVAGVVGAELAGQGLPAAEVVPVEEGLDDGDVSWRAP